MTDPRWTIKDADTMECGPVSVEVWDLHHVADLLGHVPSDAIRRPAWDALVAAVHDADTLRQAREQAAFARSQEFPEGFAHAAAGLVDLLAPEVRINDNT